MDYGAARPIEWCCTELTSWWRDHVHRDLSDESWQGDCPGGKNEGAKEEMIESKRKSVSNHGTNESG